MFDQKSAEAALKKAKPVELPVVAKAARTTTAPVRGTKIDVPASPVFTGFQKALRDGVATAVKNIKAKILVVPDFTGFQKALRDGASAAAKKVKATVPVGVQATAAPARRRAPAAAAADAEAAPARRRRAPAADATATETVKTSSAALKKALVDLDAVERNLGKTQDTLKDKTLTVVQAQRAAAEAAKRLTAAEKARVDTEKAAASLTGKDADAAIKRATKLEAAAATGAAKAQERADKLSAAQDQEAASAAAAAQKKREADQKAAASDRQRAAEQKAAAAAQKKADQDAANARKKADQDRQASERQVAADAKKAANAEKAKAAAITSAQGRQKAVFDEVAKSSAAAAQAEATNAVKLGNVRQITEDLRRARAGLAKANTDLKKSSDVASAAIKNEALRLRDLQKGNVDSLEGSLKLAKQLDAESKIRAKIDAVAKAGRGLDTAVQRTQAQERAAIVAHDAALERLRKTREAGDRAAARSALAIARETKELQKNATAANESAIAQEKRNTQVGRGIRGAAASALSLIGLRAQVLAASGAFIAGTVAVTAFQKAVSAAANVQRTFNVFRAVTGATAEELDRARAAAQDLGRDLTLPSVTAADAAEAMLSLSKAGLSVEDAISGARGVLQLATAAQISNADAASLTATALNAFSLSGSQATHVADVYANAAKAAQGEITDFATAQQQVAAVSSQVGVSFEDTTALLTLLARAGLRGSDAGTSLRTALLRLVAPTQEARTIIQALNLQIRDLQGNVRPEVFAEFTNATKNLPANLRDAAAAAIFGQDAIRAATLAGREGIEGLREAQADIGETGTAAALAEAQTEGLSGAAENLSSQLDTLGTTIGTVLLPPLEFLVTSLARSIGAINDFIGAIGRAGEAFGKFVAKVADKAGVDEAAGAFEVATEKADGFFQGLAKDARSLPGLKQLREDVFRLGDGVDGAAESLKDIPPAMGFISHAAEELGDRVKANAEAASQATASRIAGLRKELLGAINLLQTLGGVTATGEASDAARAEIDRIVKELEGFGPKGLAALQRTDKQLSGVLADNLREALEDFTGISDLAVTKIPDSIRETIERLSRLGAPGRKKLRELGQQLSEALADGIKDKKDDAVKEAREALNEAIREGQQAVRDSIRSARSNLESLAGTLADQVAEIIEAAPVKGMDKVIDQLRSSDFGIDFDTSKAIKNLDDLRGALDSFRDNVERNQLRFNLREAENDLRDAQEQIQTIGTITPAEQRQRDEFLDPFVQKTKDAQAALDEFTIENQIQNLEDFQENLKKTTQEGIIKLVKAFQRGDISAADFTKRLKNQLQPAIAALPKTDLGLGFSDEFKSTLKGVVDQVQALVGFLGIAGTAPAANVVEPADTQAEQKKRVAEAQKRLDDALAAQKKTADNSDKIVKALDLIEKHLRPGKGGNGKNSLRGSVGGPTASLNANDKVHN